MIENDQLSLGEINVASESGTLYLSGPRADGSGTTGSGGPYVVPTRRRYPNRFGPRPWCGEAGLSPIRLDLRPDSVHQRRDAFGATRPGSHGAG